MNGGHYLAIGIAWAQAESTGVRTFMLSNEAPGYLIDKLITAGFERKPLSGVAVASRLSFGRAAFRRTLWRGSGNPSRRSRCVY